MTSTPDKDAPDQWGNAQQTAHPGESVPQQSATPGQEQRADQGQAQPPDGIPPEQRAPQQGGYAGYQQQGGYGNYQGAPQQGGYGSSYQGAPPQGAPTQGAPGSPQPWTGQPGVMATGIPPVTYAETRVVGRRVIQYIVDYILAGIIPGLAYWLFDRGHGVMGGVGWLIATIIALAAYFVYWVTLPHSHHGQTFGMRLFRLRIISKDGGRASMAQLFIRGILLIVDTLVFGLVGLITMACSKYRQRVGDHAAGTVVVTARHHVME